MKDVPEIAPEIRGLLEEIVADPRSSMRLAPRHALRTWFDSGETVRASQVATTRAEQHLVDVHREALAELLCEAAWIAYWKAPVLSHRPCDRDGRLVDPAVLESSWKTRSERYSRGATAATSSLALLRSCLDGMVAGLAPTLAQASLSLVPCARTRFYVALTVPWDRPRTAIDLFERLVCRAPSVTFRAQVLVPFAARLCAAERLSDALGAYRQHTELSPDSPYGRIYAFNLACFLGDQILASRAALAVGALRKEDPRVSEARDILAAWAKTRDRQELNTARRIVARMRGDLPESTQILCGAFA